MDKIKRDEKGMFVEYRYPTAELRQEVIKRIKNGESDTEVAKWLMVDKEVALYSAVKLIQQVKKLVLDSRV